MRESYFKCDILSERSRKNLFILDAIRRRGPISKTDISGLIGLNVVTVSNYVDEFLRQKVVFEKEFDVSKGGRRPLLLDLNTSAGYAVGIGVNLIDTIGVVTDLSGKILYKVKSGKSGSSCREVLDSILTTTSALLDEAKSCRQKIKGIGIGIGGIVDAAHEKVRWPEKVNDGYHYLDVTVPLKDILEREFRIPVVVENDATLACFGEQWMALDSDIKNLIYMFSGVGCGLMINSEIYRGTTGCAGEVAIHNDKKESPYFLERWEADLGIRAEYLKRLRWKNGSASKPSRDIAAVGLKEIFEASRRGEPLAVEVVRDAGRRLGLRVAYLVNLLNPEMVVVGGGIEDAGVVLIEEIKAAVSEWSFDECASAVKIVPTRLGENGVALGAASLVVRQVFVAIND